MSFRKGQELRTIWLNDGDDGNNDEEAAEMKEVTEENGITL
jgi:hypothetical protein